MQVPVIAIIGIPIIRIPVIGIVGVIVVWIIKIWEGPFRVDGTLLLDLRALDQMAPLKHHEHSDDASYPKPCTVQCHRTTLEVQSKRGAK
jgi:hypothetical protein